MITPLSVAEPSFIEFAEETLGLHLYDWQDEAVTPFDNLNTRLVQVTLATPNGSGKSAVVIPTLVLGTLAMYPKARVVLTTADGKQLDGQVMPAIEAHRAKFPHWKFIEREITTPTGGRFVAFTTDDAGRAEGWHKLNDDDGPLLIIADEAKTIPDAIFSAIDRCTYNALLFTSSPGYMVGRFYESQFKPELGFSVIRVGLKDCPHISQDKIDRIVAAHGRDSAFARSTLDGEFMEAAGETKFDREGLSVIAAMAKEGHGRATIGRFESIGSGSVRFFPDPAGWFWMDEDRREGCRYLQACDPNTCEQAEGTTDRDNTACVILRDAYLSNDGTGTEWKTTVAGVMHWPGGVKWDSDTLARRMKLVSDYYGGCMTVVEANNFGSALMKDLVREGVALWRRTKIDDINPSKEHRLLGYLSSGKTREWWVQKCATIIREHGLVCRYLPASNEFGTFIISASGKAEAMAGCHDDWVSAIGIGLVVGCYSILALAASQQQWRQQDAGAGVLVTQKGSGALG